MLVNNAGILGEVTTPEDMTADQIRHVRETDVFGLVRVTHAFRPLLRKTTAPSVVDVTSGLGSFTLTHDPERVESQYPLAAYGSSKTDPAVRARTQAINQLKAVLVVADPAPRERLSSLGNAELFRTCATLGPSDGGGGEDAVTRATHMTLRMPAERIEQLTARINELNQRLTRLVELHAPQLLVPVGIGPDSAVTVLITMGDNPERLDSEASFAALCGVSPIEYSSGRRRTRRLNHGGDRQANAACAASSSPGYVTTRAPRRTTNAAPRRAGPAVRPDASSGMPPARSSTWSDRSPVPPRYRGVCET
ncbi:SDR family NAD(P)-dependent oxidoreductase [Streptomyces sp. NPDC093991]|uniref:SDR family NAD(P)-dependent oxidoreductase n=1 Tax=unclassified Streptomyces TaxID=2593676 RepID=UPI003430EE33